MTINFPRLDTAIDDAAQPPVGFKHDQETWASVINEHAETFEQCGTALCLAGFTAMRAGSKPPQPRQGTTYGGAHYWYLPDWFVNPDTGETVEPGSYGSVHVEEYARDLLGLNFEQADTLFAPGNTLDDIRAMRVVLHANPDATASDLLDVTDY